MINVIAILMIVIMHPYHYCYFFVKATRIYSWRKNNYIYSNIDFFSINVTINVYIDVYFVAMRPSRLPRYIVSSRSFFAYP